MWAHVKVAARDGQQLGAVNTNGEIIGKNATTNLFDRHLKPLFL
jgi:hypothetical protein